jgi:acetyl-CoA carboxylase biotin carboxylase subunit
MIRKLVIANRGEIASRVIRTARRLGIGTVAVHSEADARALHVEEADERVEIGPPAARESYLRVEQILHAARETGADAVHPGYGFLSESPALAKACRDAGLVFIGPPTDAIETMSSKISSRAAAVAAGVPVIPGSQVVGSVGEARAAAERLGYPVLIKPRIGGRGIGMHRADDESEIEASFDSTRSRADRIFGDGSVYLEKLLDCPRHIEVQIAADRQGNVIHLGERECTIQRRFQKVLEETPSPVVTPAVRLRLADAATALARHLRYASLGTVEMLVQGGDIFFLEMNTRLQIEHPVTEMVTGLDLVEWQIRVALGEPLPAEQREIEFFGHAIQCRIYAEKPEEGFIPSPGKIESFLVPIGPGIRNDVGVREGDFVTPFYDPLLGKLIVHGDDRAQAIARLERALADYAVDGVSTNIDMHRRIVADEAFRAGDLSTCFLKDRLGLEA